MNAACKTRNLFSRQNKMQQRSSFSKASATGRSARSVRFRPDQGSNPWRLNGVSLLTESHRACAVANFLGSSVILNSRSSAFSENLGSLQALTAFRPSPPINTRHTWALHALFLDEVWSINRVSSGIAEPASSPRISKPLNAFRVVSNSSSSWVRCVQNAASVSIRGKRNSQALNRFFQAGRSFRTHRSK